ncbi:MAG: GNAT family N-acetyltransferase [Calditrichia bacterium]
MISIVKVTSADLSEVVKLVQLLLTELGGTNAGSSSADSNSILSRMNADELDHTAFLAQDVEGKSVGVITVVETFAIYAGGKYGIINEMYVAPEYRSQNIGQQLIDAVKNLAQERGWARVDVTAPPEQQWKRSVQFYESNGFVFTGPKLKFKLT